MLIFFLSLLKPKIKNATHFSLSRASRSHFLKLPSIGHQEVLFWSCPPAERIPKRPYFPLPLSILAGTNLIMLLLLLLLLLFLQPPFDSQENPSPIRFPGKFILVWFPRKSKQKPQGKPKRMDFLLLPVFSGSVLGVSLLLCHWI